MRSLLALALVVPLSAHAAEATKDPTPVTKPALVVTAKDAAELFNVIQTAEVKGSDVPEVYRLMALLSQIANAPAK